MIGKIQYIVDVSEVLADAFRKCEFGDVMQEALAKFALDVMHDKELQRLCECYITPPLNEEQVDELHRSIELENVTKQL